MLWRTWLHLNTFNLILDPILTSAPWYSTMLMSCELPWAHWDWQFTVKKHCLSPPSDLRTCPSVQNVISNLESTIYCSWNYCCWCQNGSNAKIKSKIACFFEKMVHSIKRSYSYGLSRLHSRRSGYKSESPILRFQELQFTVHIIQTWLILIQRLVWVPGSYDPQVRRIVKATSTYDPISVRAFSLMVKSTTHHSSTREPWYVMIAPSFTTKKVALVRYQEVGSSIADQYSRYHLHISSTLSLYKVQYPDR